MRKITHALLAGAYLCLALTTALLVARAGGGWSGGLAAAFGLLGVFLAAHGAVAQAFGRAETRRELGKLRDANRLLAEQLLATHAEVETLGERLSAEAAQRSQMLGDEVRMLEQLVARMGEGMERRLEAKEQAPARRGAPAPRHDPADALLETVRSALTDNRVDLYLQPVVSLPQRRPMFYESYTRLRDESGRVMMPAEYLTVAEPGGLMAAIDNLLLFRCVQVVRRLAKQDRKVGIFCNVSKASLADEAFFPQFLEFLGENRDLAGALIFEMGQAQFETRGAVEARNMARLADLGFRFSIDKVDDLDLDFADLARAQVSFVKVGAKKLLSDLLELDGRMTLRTLKDIQASDYAALTRRYGVELIAEKVENEREVIDVLELDVAYGQGHLFGEPRPIRDSILAEAEPPAALLQTARRRVGAR